MTTLILCTSQPNDLFVSRAVKENSKTSGDIIVVATNASANNALKQAGLPSQFIFFDLPINRKEENRKFSDLAMPGVFGDTLFGGTDFPVWKALSIDRLSFWSEGSRALAILGALSALKWNKLITDLNIYSPYPFAAFSICRNRGGRSIAIQSHTLRSKEFFDIAPHLDFDEFIVLKGEEQLARKTGAKIIVGGEANTKQTEDRSASDLRSGLGIGSKEYVTGIMFDKIHEIQAKMYLEWLLKNKGGIPVFFTVDSRSRVLLRKCLYPHQDIIRHLDLSMHSVCDEVVAFGWHESLRGIKGLKIIDWYGISGAKDVAPEGVSVSVLPD